MVELLELHQFLDLTDKILQSLVQILQQSLLLVAVVVLLVLMVLSLEVLVVLVEEEVLTLVLVVQELLDKVMQEELHQLLPQGDTLSLIIIGEAVAVALDREVPMDMNLKEQVVKVYIHQ
tara:strand:+ start:232 stop:591 length:360 start_codon:yes stop_codon:yes gene_type:complete